MDFFCYNLGLTSLKGCPKEVTGLFNKLETLDYLPIKIGSHFSCSHNKLKDLKGCP